MISAQIETQLLCNLAKVCEHKTKDCARSWTFQHNLVIFVFSFEVCRTKFHNQFLIITMPPSSILVTGVLLKASHIVRIMMYIGQHSSHRLQHVRGEAGAQACHSLCQFLSKTFAR